MFGASPQIMRNDATGFEFRYTTPTPGEADGAAEPGAKRLAGALERRRQGSGRSRSATRPTGGTGLFQNRELHVMVIR